MKRTIPLLFCATVSTPVGADGTFTLGAFTSNSDHTYIDHDDWNLTPYIAYDTDRFHFGLDGVSYGVVATDQTALSIGFTSNYGDIFDQDIALFDGLDRKADLQLELSASHDFGGVFVEGDIAVDVSDAQSGHLVTMAAGYTADLSMASLSVTGGVTYTSDDHNQYYYGVSTDEARTDRALYLADEAFLPFVILEMLVPVSDHVLVVTQIQFTDLTDVKDSALLDHHESTTALLGGAYQF